LSRLGRLPGFLRMTNRSPFRYFRTSPEIILLAVMIYVRFPHSLRNVEDLLHERGIDPSYETVRFWWHRFGPLFASEIRKRRVSGMRSSRWRWQLDEIQRTWHARLAGNGSMGQQSLREFAPAVPKALAGDAPLPADANITEVRIRPRLGPHPVQCGAHPLKPGHLQGQPHRRSHRMASALRSLTPVRVWPNGDEFACV
jgi:hypothetical protein